MGKLYGIFYDMSAQTMTSGERPAKSARQRGRGEGTHPRRLRDRQKDLTRESVLQALAEIAAEGHVLTFTVQDVADRAGVSHRSLYRHFPTRKALLEALYEWGVARLDVSAVVAPLASVDELPRLAGKLFALFDTQPAWIRAVVIATVASDIRPRARIRRNKPLEDLIAGLTSNLDPSESRRVFAVMRYLISSQAWLVLREQFGLDGEERAKAVAWALRTLAEDVKGRNAVAGNQARSG